MAQGNNLKPISVVQLFASPHEQLDKLIGAGPPHPHPHPPPNVHYNPFYQHLPTHPPTAGMMLLATIGVGVSALKL